MSNNETNFELNVTTTGMVMEMPARTAAVVLTGTLHGHVVAGVAFILSGIWSTILTFKKYFESRYRGTAYWNRFGFL